MVSGKQLFRNVVFPVPFALILALLWPFAGQRAAASGPSATVIDASVLWTMEQRAASADPRDRCFLYAEVLSGLTELEGRQITAGEDEQARQTMEHMNEVAAKIHTLQMDKANRLIDTEKLLDRTTRRVQDMVRVVSAQQQAAMQSTLKQLNMVHSEVLAMVFAH